MRIIALVVGTDTVFRNLRDGVKETNEPTSQYLMSLFFRATCSQRKSSTTPGATGWQGTVKSQ